MTLVFVIAEAVRAREASQTFDVCGAATFTGKLAADSSIDSHVTNRCSESSRARRCRCRRSNFTSSVTPILR